MGWAGLAVDHHAFRRPEGAWATAGGGGQLTLSLGGVLALLLSAAAAVPRKMVLVLASRTSANVGTSHPHLVLEPLPPHKPHVKPERSVGAGKPAKGNTLVNLPPKRTRSDDAT